MRPVLRKHLSSALLIGLLISCAPFQDATTGAINQTTGDEAVLGAAPKSLIFIPGGTVTDVLVDVLGDELVALDPLDNCTGTPQHLQCALGRVDEVASIELTGRGVSAVVNYRRAGRVMLEALVVPP